MNTILPAVDNAAKTAVNFLIDQTTKRVNCELFGKYAAQAVSFAKQANKHYRITATVTVITTAITTFAAYKAVKAVIAGVQNYFTTSTEEAEKK